MKKGLSRICIALVSMVILLISAMGTAMALDIDEDKILERFPEGMPASMTEEEINYILDGNYAVYDNGEEVITYNPENNPRSARATVWDLDMTKSQTLYPSYATLKYNKGTVTAKGSITFNIGAQGNIDEVGYANLRGRAWVQVKGANNKVADNQSEDIFMESGQARIYVSTSVSGCGQAERVCWAMRNLLTDWNMRYEIY